jgi:hypothetical protein
MKPSKKILFALYLSGTIFVSNHALAVTPPCRGNYMEDKFQVAQIDDEDTATCIYSASAIYNLIGKFKPILERGSKWKYGHGGWYCQPTSKDPKACPFKAISA